MTDAVNLDAEGLPIPDPDFDAKRKAAFMAYFKAAADGDDFNSMPGPSLYGDDPGNWRDLSALIPTLLVTSAGGSCPYQAEGTLHGYDFYFRYRGGSASLEVASDPDSLGSLWYASRAHGGRYDGTLGRQDFIDLMVVLVADLQPAPFLYEFSGYKIKVVHDEAADSGQPDDAPKTLHIETTDTPEIYRSWGHTPREAIDRFAEPSAYLTEHGWSEESQRQAVDAQRLDPTPLNTDNRTYPSETPRFEVHDLEAARERVAAAHQQMLDR